MEYHTREGKSLRVLGHHAFRVKIAGEQYAIDVAGFQFGHHRAVTPWRDYEGKMVKSIVNIMPFRTNSASEYYGCMEFAAGFSPDVPLTQHVLARYLDLMVLEAIGHFSSNMHSQASLRYILRQPDARFHLLAVVY